MSANKIARNAGVLRGKGRVLEAEWPTARAVMTISPGQFDVVNLDLFARMLAIAGEHHLGGFEVKIKHQRVNGLVLAFFDVDARVHVHHECVKGVEPEWCAKEALGEGDLLIASIKFHL